MNRVGVRLDPVDTWFFRDGRPTAVFSWDPDRYHRLK